MEDKMKSGRAHKIVEAGLRKAQANSGNTNNPGNKSSSKPRSSSNHRVTTGATTNTTSNSKR